MIFVGHGPPELSGAHCANALAHASTLAEFVKGKVTGCQTFMFDSSRGRLYTLKTQKNEKRIVKQNAKNQSEM
jgi:hypothetical protein